MSRYSTQEIDELIANGRRLVAEAQEAIARSDRFFAEHNIDPAECLEFVRTHGGDAAVQEVQAQVKATIDSIEDELRTQRFHATRKRPTGRRLRLNSNMA